tara:strand:- start:1345 stop:4239 length:2895 start_codon:yes stop_codon:yes gene_type:complete
MGISWTKETINNSGTTGTTASTSFIVDDIKIDGSNIGHTDDTDLLSIASGTLSVNGILAATGNITTGGNIGTTGDADLLSLADNAVTLNGTLSASGLVTATSGLKLGNNIIYASDGGSTITLDTSDNVTILGDLAVTGGDITSSSGAISFGNENLSTTGWASLGIVGREADEVLRVHGTTTTYPSILLTSITTNEGGEIKIKGTAGNGGSTDYSDYYGLMDMFQKRFRLIYDAKGANMAPEEILDVSPQGTAGNEEQTFTKIKHMGDGKIVLMGSETNSSAYDKVEIGAGGDKDQFLVFNNSGTDRYMGIDADQSDKFCLGTGATMNSNVTLEIDTSHNVQLNGGLTVGIDGTGHDVKLYGDDPGNFMLWDQSEDRLEIRNDYARAGLLLSNTLADATNCPAIDYYRNSASATASDVLGITTYKGRNAVNDADVIYARLQSSILDATKGGEEGKFKIGVMAGGTGSGAGGGSGFVQDAFALSGQSDGTVDVNIGSGAASVTTLRGDLTITGGNITKGTSILLDTNSRIKQSTGGGTSNTTFGKFAGDVLTTNGNYNTFISEWAGKSNTTGANNVGIGYYALRTNIDGDCNVGIGVQALEDFEASSDGEGYNTAIGHQASKEMTTGERNTFIGYRANSEGVTTGQGANVGVGYQAGQDITSAVGSVLMGSNSGYNITEGNYNTCIGMDTGKSLITATNNTLIGRAAGASVTSNQNTMIGDSAGFEITSGAGHTLVGYQAGYGLDDSGGGAGTGHTTGDHNTAVGFQAGKLMQEACADNTYIGAYSGNVTTTGTENTCLGYNTDIQDATATNQIVIGNNIVGTADNAVHLGNNTSHIRCDFNADQTWDASSDRRQKKDIETTDIGLDFINDLNPVKYKHKSPSEFPEEWTAYDAEDTTPMGGSDKYYYGFIAQEVKETVDKYNVGDYSAWGEDPDGRQRVSKESMIVTLVKAVQELTARVEELEKE